MPYHLIYDGDCNLCVSLVRLLEALDRGRQFDYAPMQDERALQAWDVSPQACALGMVAIDAQAPERRWQGSEAAELIAQQLPLAREAIAAYLAVPGLKRWGDRAYAQIRDRRYAWFGQRERTYRSAYPVGCQAREHCSPRQ